MNGRLLTAEEVAEVLAVPVSWVRESSRSGAIPCIRLGRYVRFERGVSWRIKYQDADGRQVKETLGREAVRDRRKAERALGARLADVEKECANRPGAPSTISRTSSRPWG